MRSADDGTHPLTRGRTVQRALSHVRVTIRDLRNETRSVIDAVDHGVEVVLTRRGHPVARVEDDTDDRPLGRT
jgi:prevent-host-death family protein